MYVAAGSARRAAMDFGELQQHNGREVETERVSVQSRTCDYTAEGEYRRALACDSRDRMRAQEACRAYWVAMYGADAERASRGGVMWV